MLIFLPGFFSNLASAEASAVWAGIYIGIFPSAVAYSLFAYAISKLPVTLVAAFLYSVPVFGLFFSWLLLGEVPSWLTLVGGLIAICGIVIVNQSKKMVRVSSATD
jgi:drug/metabolite transporter (DMT)-like permease